MTKKKKQLRIIADKKDSFKKRYPEYKVIRVDMLSTPQRRMLGDAHANLVLKDESIMIDEQCLVDCFHVGSPEIIENVVNDQRISLKRNTLEMSTNIVEEADWDFIENKFDPSDEDIVADFYTLTLSGNAREYSVSFEDRGEMLKLFNIIDNWINYEDNA